MKNQNTEMKTRPSDLTSDELVAELLKRRGNGLNVQHADWLTAIAKLVYREEYS